ncbi:MAG TPA: GTP pyrophosphokinase family protein [Clostridia bacterium]|nr:GTP pyrophosphokinase family protein [Clostridia bacterium]
MMYKFALDEMKTRIDILKQEFQYVHDYNPIEHVEFRIKSPKSILRKIRKKGCELSLPSIRENINDIAGIRIVCSFISDIYKISEMIQNQKDIKIIEYKDYIKNPKPNGYQSLHLIVEVPVFMTDRVENVRVEIQIRTIGMDFWASLEHKIYYKCNMEIPEKLKNELKDAADTVRELDMKMELINKEISKLKDASNLDEDTQEIFVNDQKFYLPEEFLKLLDFM